MRLLILLILAMSSLAHAAPHQVLVLRAEGSADQATRTTIDTHVLRLAKNIDGKIDAGDITLTEASAAVGCNPSDAACKDELLAMMGVDEIVATTATASGPTTNVTVRRMTKGKAPRVAQTSIPSGKAPDAKINADIGPLFGLSAPPVPAEPEPAKPAPEPKPAEPAPPPVATAPPPTTDPGVTAAPAGQVQPQPVEGRRPSKWPKVGMVVGGVMIVFGALMWAKASDLQGQIDEAPANTPADFAHLAQLERDADGAAGGGNLFVVGGAILGGVSTYYFLKQRRSSSTQQARIVPTVFPGGAGVTLTFGGAR